MGKLVKRARSFLRWRATLKNLQSALPDASADDISSFADDCAICKVSMASTILAGSMQLHTGWL